MGSAFLTDPEDVVPNPSDNENDSSATVAAQERALVYSLITSVWESLKIENTSGAAEELAVPFSI